MFAGGALKLIGEGETQSGLGSFERRLKEKAEGGVECLDERLRMMRIEGEWEDLSVNVAGMKRVHVDSELGESFRESIGHDDVARFAVGVRQGVALAAGQTLIFGTVRVVQIFKTQIVEETQVGTVEDDSGGLGLFQQTD